MSLNNRIRSLTSLPYTVTTPYILPKTATEIGAALSVAPIRIENTIANVKALVNKILYKAKKEAPEIEARLCKYGKDCAWATT